MALTNRSLNNMIEGQIIWDEKLSGFGARKQTSQGNVSFIVKTRLNGRQKIFTKINLSTNYLTTNVKNGNFSTLTDISETKVQFLE